MEYFRKIIYLFANPFIIIAASLLFSFLLPIDFSLIFVAIIFLISVIAIILKRKWLNLFLSLFTYLVFLIFLLFEYVDQHLMNRPSISIGDDEFYRNEILENIDLVLPDKLTVIAKIDTVHYIGGGDYSAGCIYQGSQENIFKLQKSISKNKKFKLVKEEVTLPESFSFVSKKSQKNLSFTSVYKYENEGCCNFEFAFDKTKTRMYFYEFFY